MLNALRLILNAIKMELVWEICLLSRPLVKVLKFAATEVDERKNYLLIILSSSDLKFNF